MSSVTFSSSVGGDNTTITDDSNASTGLANGGHRTRFVPALSQMVAIASYTVTQASNAGSSASAASTSASTASTQASNATTTYTNFDKRYLGAKAADPTLDNQGAALVTGALYWNTGTGKMRICTGGTAFTDITTTGGGALQVSNNLSEITATAATARGNLGLGSIAVKNSLLAADIPVLDWTKITTGKPTTLAGYGITDAVGSTHASDATLHLTSGQNTWLDAITATAAQVNYLTGSSPGAILNNTAVIRNANGYINASYINMTAGTVTGYPSKIAIETSSDGYLRWTTPANLFINHRRSNSYRETVGGTFVAGGSYSLYPSTGPLTMNLPTYANTQTNDKIEVIQLVWGGVTWETTNLTIACDASTRFAGQALGESLIIDLNIGGFNLVCVWKDIGAAEWQII